MSEVASLIRQFPEGSFILLLALIWACERVVVTFVNRNKPVCDCDCCNTDLDDDACEEVETEVEDD